MFITILIIIIAVSGIVMLIYSLPKKERGSWVQFYAKGKECGFSLKEIDHLRRLTVKAKLNDPVLVFTSQEELDKCIRSLVNTIHISGGLSVDGSQDFLSVLYDYRKRTEIEKREEKQAISDTSRISDGQNLRVLIKGLGVFRSQVVKNTNTYLAISRPVSEKQGGSFSWMGQILSVYFWREEDAGYVFDSKVIDEVFSKGISSLKITHSTSLFRTQKRKSVRVKMNKAAFLYPLVNDDEANSIEVNPGLKCFIQDLSDTGCAALIGGKGAPGLRIKVQFALNNFPICMGGTVRSVEYQEDRDRSILRVEADPIPIDVRNHIMGEVFGMLPEEEEDLPFRMLGDEADEMVAEMNLPKVNVQAPIQENRGDIGSAW